MVIAASPAQVVSIHWERIQVIIRLRPARPDDIEPSTVGLQRVDDPAVRVAATRTWTDGGDLFVRCNVMQGPRGVPLAPGAWVLAVQPPDGASSPLAVAGDRPLHVDPARFPTRRGLYAVSTAIVGDQLRLDVSLQRVPRWRRVLRIAATLVLRAPRLAAFASIALAYRIAERVARRDPNRILFVGHYGTDLSGDMQAVLAAMASRGVNDERTIVTLPPLRRRGIRDWIRLPFELARAGTIVIEEDVLYMFPRISARIIQIWHASGALKTIGYSRVGKPGARSPWSRNYKYFDWAVVSGEHDVPLFAEAFGMPEGRVLPLGHPRMDRFFDPAWRERAREATLTAIPNARGRRMILFAPTWRRQGTARVYDLSVLDYPRLYELCTELNAVFVIRLHPTVVHPVVIPAEFSDRIVNGTTSVMDAPDQLCATDLLITDYSSIILEYSLLGRPMLFFAPDLEAYRADRDVYMPYEDFVPGRIVQTFDDMLAAIRHGDFQLEKAAPFAASQFTYQDGGATDRVVDLILGS